MDVSRAGKALLPWAKVEELTQTGGLQLAERLVPIAGTIAQWLPGATAVELESRRRVVFKILETAATQGNKPVFHELRGLLEKAYPERKFKILEAAVLFTKVTGTAQQKLEAFASLGACPETEAAKSMKCAEHLFSHRAYQLALKVCALGPNRLLSSAENVTFVRDAIQSAGAVNAQRDQVRQLVDGFLLQQGPEVSPQLKWSLLFTSLTAGVYDAKSAPPIEAVREIILSQIDLQGPLAARAILELLSATAWKDGFLCGKILEFHSGLSADDKCAALPIALPTMGSEVTTEWAYKWAEACLQADDLVGAAYLLEVRGVDHSLDCRDFVSCRTRLLQVARQKDPTYQQCQLWETLWKMDLAGPNEQRRIEPEEMVAIIHALNTKSVIRYAIQALANPLLLPDDLAEERFFSWSVVHSDITDRIVNLFLMTVDQELLAVLKQHFNPECFAMGELKPQVEGAARSKALMVVAMNLLLVARGLEEASARSELYACLTEAGLTSVLSDPRHLMLKERLLFTRQAAHLFAHTGDWEVAFMFLTSLRQGDAPAGEGTVFDSKWLAVTDEMERAHFAATASRIINKVMDSNSPEHFQLLIDAQNLRASLVPGDWRLEVAVKLAEYGDNESLCAAVEHGMRFLKHRLPVGEGRRPGLLVISRILLRAMRVIISDQQQEKPRMPWSLRERIAASLPTDRFPPQEVGAVTVVALFHQCITAKDSDVFIPKLAELVDFLEELCAQGHQDEILNLCRSELILVQQQIPDDRLAKSPIYQITRHLLLATVARFKDGYGLDAIMQALPHLQRLCLLAADDDLVLDCCRFDLLPMLQHAIDCQKDAPAPTGLWDACFAELSSSIETFGRHLYTDTQLAGYPHRGLRVILIVLKSMAESAGIMHRDEARMRQLYPLIVAVKRIQDHFKWPVAEASRLLLAASISASDEPFITPVNLTDPLNLPMPGLPLIACQTATLQIEAIAKMKPFTAGNKVADTVTLERILSIADQTYHQAMWGPIALLVELSSLVFTCTVQYTELHGEDEIWVKRWWSVVNRPERLHGLTLDALRTATRRCFDGESDPERQNVRFSVTMVMPTTTVEHVLLPHHALNIWPRKDLPTVQLDAVLVLIELLQAECAWLCGDMRGVGQDCITPQERRSLRTTYEATLQTAIRKMQAVVSAAIAKPARGKGGRKKK